MRMLSVIVGQTLLLLWHGFRVIHTSGKPLLARELLKFRILSAQLSDIIVQEKRIQQMQSHVVSLLRN